MSKTFQAVLVGQTPVLMNRLVLDGADMAKMSPEEQAERASYRDSEGFLAFPSENIIRGLITAGKGIRKGGGQGKATISSVIASAVIPTTTEFRLLDKENNPVKKFEMHAKPIVNPATGGRTMRYRPMIRDWRLPVSFRFNEDLLTEKQLREALEKLGQLVGIGDWRPECKGSHGVAVLEI